MPLGYYISGEIINLKKDLDIRCVFKILELFRDDDGKMNHSIINVESFKSEDRNKDNIFRYVFSDDCDN